MVLELEGGGCETAGSPSVPRSEVPAGDRVSRGKVHCPATNAARCDSHLVPHRSIEQDMVSLVKYIVGAQHSEPI